jgi:hypothetical protein
VQNKETIVTRHSRKTSRSQIIVILSALVCLGAVTMAAMIAFGPDIRAMFEQGPSPQDVRWGSHDRKQAGICLPSGQFIPWSQLKPELERNLLSQLSPDVPADSTVTAEIHEEKDCWIPSWTVSITNKNGNPIGRMWLGADPRKNWSSDGRIFVGTLDDPTQVWAAFRRYSDGSYRQVPLD